MMSIHRNEIAILSINGAGYHGILNRTSKIDAANLLKNADLTKKRSIIKMKHYKDLLRCIEHVKKL